MWSRRDKLGRESHSDMGLISSQVGAGRRDLSEPAGAGWWCDSGVGREVKVYLKCGQQLKGRGRLPSWL